MIILGVADGPDASAALVVNGQLVAAVAQERVDRELHSRAFPSGAIDAVLDVAGLRARDVDRIAFGSSVSPSTLLQSRPGLRARVTPRWREAWRGVQSGLRATGLYMVEQDVSRKLLGPRFRELGFERATIELMEHDRAHVTAAYRCQERAEALIVTLDTAGDGVAVSVSVGRHLQLERLFQQTALASVATFPVRVADALGIEPSAIGARAAGGTPPAALVDAFRREIGVEGDGFQVRGLVAHPDPMVGKISGFEPADVAAAALEAIVAAVTSFVGRWVERARLRHVVVAGTVFADPYVAGRLAGCSFLESLTVCPATGDEGLSIGAALGASGAALGALDHLELGPRYTDTHLYKALSVASLPRNKVDDPVATAADLLARGQSVARFDGALEVGFARANRGVFFRPDDPAVGARARAALRLPEWAPAAAVTAAAAPFGQATPAPASASALAAFARPDGWWTPWRANEGVAAILANFQTRTGLAHLAQLELRLPGEPVACSPGDAIQAWRTSDVDALLLGNYLVERSAT